MWPLLHPEWVCGYSQIWLHGVGLPQARRVLVAVVRGTLVQIDYGGSDVSLVSDRKSSHAVTPLR